MNKQSGFTLLEMIVVMAIVGLLSQLAISEYKGWKRKLAVMEMQTIVERIVQKRQVEEKTVLQITGTACADCVCRFGEWQTTACKVSMDAFYQAFDYNSAPRTPWGGFYYIDNNEGESFWIDRHGSACFQDTVTFWDHWKKEPVSMSIPPSRHCEAEAIDVFGAELLDGEGNPFTYTVPSIMYEEN